ncbi:hypothetical protein P7K49_034387 [Saguinus oedipus]|uniref:Uncharacterized protein n=1 Tax=Saguinus oedipus TaxID=9490 RepID=A0ABQ9TVF1_SAGOE|nr:hypothetical protein P7K49_034387 [Saguinus oedipus]
MGEGDLEAILEKRSDSVGQDRREPGERIRPGREGLCGKRKEFEVCLRGDNTGRTTLLADLFYVIPRAPASALGTPGARPPPAARPRPPGHQGREKPVSPSGSAVGSRRIKKGPQEAMVTLVEQGQ